MGLTKGHGPRGTPVSLQLGQNPANLLLNPVKSRIGTDLHPGAWAKAHQLRKVVN